MADVWMCLDCIECSFCVFYSQVTLSHTTHTHPHTAPSGPPLNVRAKPGGGGSVLVTWTPPTGGVNGYVIVYGPTNAADTETLSVRVDDSAATTHTIEGISTEREYTVHMWAFLDLPSSLSNSDTVFLDGENTHTDTHTQFTHTHTHTHTHTNTHTTTTHNHFQ